MNTGKRIAAFASAVLDIGESEDVQVLRDALRLAAEYCTVRLSLVASGEGSDEPVTDLRAQLEMVRSNLDFLSRLPDWSSAAADETLA